MNDLVEILYNGIIDGFLKLADNKSGRSTWVRIGALILGIGTMLAYIIHCYWLA